MVAVDFSDDTTLYAVIGGGALVVLVLLVCCCCCRCKRKKKQAAAHKAGPAAEPATSPVLVPEAPPRGASQKLPTGASRPPSQKSYVVDIEDSATYVIMSTSPALERAPGSAASAAPTVLELAPRSAASAAPTVLEPALHNYYQHQHKAVVFHSSSAPAPTELSPLATTAPNSIDRTTGGDSSSVGYGGGGAGRGGAGPHNSNSSGRSGPSTNDLMSIVDDPAIVASRLPFDTIMPLVLISKGGYGEVHKGSYRGAIVAIKRLLPETKRDLKQIASFFQEVKLMATMEHPHIVQFIGVAWDSFSDLSVVTEFMEGGDLRAALNEFDRVGRPLGFDKQKATIALHIAHALTYMHSLQPVVLHRDLKSKNILLDATQSVAKLTDFGISRERSDQTMTAGVGTLLWMAPEVMAGERYNDKADVFSFGIVLWELDTYLMPYADIKARLAEEAGRCVPDTALVQRILTGRVRVTFSSALRGDVRALGEACVALDPAVRPTAAQVLYELQKIERTMASEITIIL